MKNSTQRNEKLRQVKSFIPDLTVTVQRSRLSHCKNGLAQKYTFSIITKKGEYTGIFTDSIYSYGNNVIINFDDILYSWITDADCFKYSETFDDFCLQFGYNFKSYNTYDDEYELERHKAEKAWNGCKYAYKKMIKLLTDEQIEKLHDLFQDY